MLFTLFFFFCFTVFVLFIFSILLLIWSYIESQSRQINIHSVSLRKKLPRALRILHLSDIHFATHDVRLSAFFDKLARDTFDFVFITGDIFDCEAGIPMAVKNLKKLKAVHGIFAVFGNHDHFDYRFFDIATMGFRGRRHPDTPLPLEKLAQALKEAGVRLLQNESAALTVDGVSFSLFGLDDPTTGFADIEKAMHSRNDKDINILLTHVLDAFFYIGENEIDLSFSGHTHGGQIRFPFIGAVITHTQYGPKYASGVFTLKGAICAVSRGMGASRHFFLRLLCRPEALVLEVKP